MTVRNIFTILCCLPLMAVASDMLELNGLRPGISKSAIDRQMPALKCTPDTAKVPQYSECNYIRTNPHQEAVDALNSLGGEFVEAWQFRFDDDILGRIVVSFDPSAFDKVVSALRAKFGEPTGRARETLYSRAGTPVISRQFSWRRNGQTMVATEFDGRMGRSVVSVASDAHLNKARA